MLLGGLQGQRRAPVRGCRTHSSLTSGTQTSYQLKCDPLGISQILFLLFSVTKNHCWQYVVIGQTRVERIIWGVIIVICLLFALFAAHHIIHSKDDMYADYASK